MTNPLKGEVEVELAGKTYACRLTLNSLIKIETVLGRGIIKTAQNMAEGDVILNDVVQILLPALRGGGNDLQEKDIHRLIQESGIVASTLVAANLLAQTLTETTNTSDDSEENSQEKKLVKED